MKVEVRHHKDLIKKILGEVIDRSDIAFHFALDVLNALNGEFKGTVEELTASLSHLNDWLAEHEDHFKITEITLKINGKEYD